MTYCIGLTGGIGCGKSTVAELFQELGVVIIDSDVISHQLTQPGGAAISTISAVFGNDYLTVAGAMNRMKMRNLVFSDDAARIRLESILHPLIRAQIQIQVQTSITSPYILLVVPLLFEAEHYRELVQRTLVVDCPEELQINRAMRRSSLNEQEVRAIIARQMPAIDRLKHADDIIHNHGSMNELKQQVRVLHQQYLSRSSAPHPVRH